MRIIEGEGRSADANMRLDEQWLEEGRAEPLLHFYSWEAPALTYGYFIKPEEFLDLKELEARGIQMGRRPTGGGILFHIWDLAFGAVIPRGRGYHDNTLDNYRFVNGAVQRAVKRLSGELQPLLLSQDPEVNSPAIKNFCMAKPTIYDVMVDGRKIAGAAQRKKKHAYLHQGSISLAYPDEALLQAVVKEKSVREAMLAQTYAFQGEIDSIRRQLKEFLIQEFENLYN